MNDFRIDLENLPVFYTPGQTLVGEVLFNVTKDEEKVEEITLKCVGGALVEWTQEYKWMPLRKTKIFSKAETYIDEFVPLDIKVPEYDAKSMSGSVRNFHRGLHVFPFNYKLPLKIPASFDSVYGRIIYALEARVKIKPKKKETFSLDTRLEFPVNDVLDLNDYPDYLKPLDLKKSKSVWCFCCQNGPIGFNVSLNKTGFVAGENITNVTDLFNFSSRNAPDTHVVLVRDMYFYTDLKTKTVSTTILGDLCLPGIGPGENETLENSWTIIPRSPPVNLLGCNIIKVQHYLMFQMDISFSFNLRGRIPIIIGMTQARDELLEKRGESSSAGRNLGVFDDLSLIPSYASASPSRDPEV